MNFENNKILIIGGSGFIGGHLFSKLSQKNKVFSRKDSSSFRVQRIFNEQFKFQTSPQNQATAKGKSIVFPQGDRKYL